MVMRILKEKTWPNKDQVLVHEDIQHDAARTVCVCVCVCMCGYKKEKLPKYQFQFNRKSIEGKYLHKISNIQLIMCTGSACISECVKS